MTADFLHQLVFLVGVFYLGTLFGKMLYIAFEKLSKWKDETK